MSTHVRSSICMICLGLLSSGIYASMQVNFWIGATDQTIEGGWSWTDGSPFRFLNWYPGKTYERKKLASMRDDVFVLH